MDSIVANQLSVICSQWHFPPLDLPELNFRPLALKNEDLSGSEAFSGQLLRTAGVSLTDAYYPKSLLSSALRNLTSFHAPDEIPNGDY
jgi:hypothetical protein